MRSAWSQLSRVAYFSPVRWCIGRLTFVSENENHCSFTMTSFPTYLCHVVSMLRAINVFVPSVCRAALLDKRSLAQPSPPPVLRDQQTQTRSLSLIARWTDGRSAQSSRLTGHGAVQSCANDHVALYDTPVWVKKSPPAVFWNFSKTVGNF